MRNQKHNQQLVTRALLIVAAALTVSGCSKMFTHDSNHGSGEPVSEALNSAGTVGIKSQAQAIAYVGVATNIPINATGLAADAGGLTPSGITLGSLVSNAKPWLAQDRNVNNLNSTMQLSFLGLASSFCAADVKTQSGQASGSRKVYVGVNFPGGIAAITPAIIDGVLAKAGPQFLGRAYTPDEIAILKTLIAESRLAISDGSDATTKTRASAQIWTLVCGTTLASLSGISI